VSEGHALEDVATAFVMGVSIALIVVIWFFWWRRR
jgi:hypothetical protein